MIVLLNGPLGVGKSTLAEVLVSRIPNSVMIDGDAVVEVNPAPPDEVALLHATIHLLVGHYARFGYRHVVVNHLWTRAEDLRDLALRLASGSAQGHVHCFRLTIPWEENARRILARARGADSRTIDAQLRTATVERRALDRARGDALGHPMDAIRAPDHLADLILAHVSLTRRQ